jgi:hypothetical protein
MNKSLLQRLWVIAPMIFCYVGILGQPITVTKS